MPPTPATIPETSESAMLVRVLTNGRRHFPPELARYLLQVEFSDANKARMHALAKRNQDGTLTPPAKDELLNYVKVGDLLALLQSRARRSLKKKQAS